MAIQIKEMPTYKKVVTTNVGPFAKKGEDIKDGDIVTVLNEGKKVAGEWGDRDVFLVKLVNGEEKNINFNQTSINNMVDAFGENATNWVGKEVKVWINRQNIGGKWVQVLIVSHPNAVLTDEGFVTNSAEDYPIE